MTMKKKKILIRVEIIILSLGLPDKPWLVLITNNNNYNRVHLNYNQLTLYLV